MASLPSDRLCEEPPFTYCGVDLFGPFATKEGRKELKHYGALFICLSSRAIHIKTAASLNTDSFILCLRRFIGHRGNIRPLRSDNGSNFVGASSEFKKAFAEMDQLKINDFMRDSGGEWMLWKLNLPPASNMGGVWERQIRSARTTLTSSLKTHGTSLNHELLCTLLIEVEVIVNSRPLTTDLLSDVNSMMLLSPINLLTLKSRVVMLPLEFLLHQTFIVINIGEECSTSLMRFGVDEENKFLQHFSVDKNGTPLGEIAKWEILSYSGKQQNEIVGQWQK